MTKNYSNTHRHSYLGWYIFYFLAYIVVVYKKVLYGIDRLFQKIGLILLWFYQYTLSPDKGIPSLWLKGRICMHEPHCSEYAKLCLQRYGFFASIWKITQRIFSCTWGMHKIYDPEKYRVVFFASAPIGVPFLEKLHEDKRFDITGIVTMPDAPAGRGMKMQENVIKKKWNSMDYDIQNPNSLRLDSKKYGDEAKQFQQWLADKKPDFLVVIAYGKIIPQYILDIPTFWPINVHGSILPKYRGASPIQSVFLNDEKETGITIMKMDAWLDTGDMIDVLKIPLKFTWTAKDVINKMQELWTMFLVDTLRNYGKWLLGEVKQDDAQATHCNKIEKEDGLIDPYTDSIASIYQKYRAYILWPKIYFMHGDKRVIIEELLLDEALYQANKDKSLIENETIDTAVISCQVKVAWKKSSTLQEFIRNYVE